MEDVNNKNVHSSFWTKIFNYSNEKSELQISPQSIPVFKFLVKKKILGRSLKKKLKYFLRLSTKKINPGGKRVNKVHNKSLFFICHNSLSFSLTN